jgi:N-acyl-D-amino-acid deacylase
VYDLVIRNGRIVDGTGQDAYVADIGVRADKIVAIGDLWSETAVCEIDATGRVVTPGFIEPHCHADLFVLMNPRMEAYLMQGVTTVVGGNCGHSMAPMGDEVYRSAIVDFPVTFAAHPQYFDQITLILPRPVASKAIEELYGICLDWHSFSEYRDKCNNAGMDCNIAPLAGYSAIRHAVMGMDCMREATADELNKIADAVEDCMEAGAFGLSTGLDPSYVPGMFATDDETIRMLQIVKNHDGIFTSHTFNVGPDGRGGRMEGYEKMLCQAKLAGVRANVSHVHVIGMATTAEGSLQAARDTLAYFEKMKGEGVDLSYDVIPSPANIDFTIPYFAFFLRPFVLMSGSRHQLAKNFTVSDFRQMVHTVIEAGMYPALDSTQPMNYFSLLSVTVHKNPVHIGKNLAAYAEEKGMASLDLVMDLFAEDPDMAADLNSESFDEANELLCRNPMAMPCADGFSCSNDTNFTGDDELPLYPNPMTFSYIPRYILKHGKQRFEDTIRQITGFVADRFGIPDRGVLQVGNYADIVVLDKDKLHGYDEDENPLQYPEGFHHVIVNGIPVIENKRHLDAMPGRMLTKK